MAFLYKVYLSRYFYIRTELGIGEGGALNKIYFLSLKRKPQLYNCKDEFCSVREGSGLAIIIVLCPSQRATLHPLPAVLFSAQCCPVSSSPLSWSPAAAAAVRGARVACGLLHGSIWVSDVCDSCYGAVLTLCLCNCLRC